MITFYENKKAEEVLTEVVKKQIESIKTEIYQCLYDHFSPDDKRDKIFIISHMCTCHTASETKFSLLKDMCINKSNTANNATPSEVAATNYTYLDLLEDYYGSDSDEVYTAKYFNEFYQYYVRGCSEPYEKLRGNACEHDARLKKVLGF